MLRGMSAIARPLVYLTAVFVFACCSVAAAQFTLEDVAKVQEEILARYPDGGDKKDVYREFAASEAYFRPTDHSALVSVVLPGRVETVTGGVPSFVFASTLWSTIIGSTSWEERKSATSYTFPPDKRCGRFEALLWETSPGKPPISLRTASAGFKLKLEAQGYTYRPARAYNEFVNGFSAALTSLQPKFFLTLLKNAKLNVLKRSLLAEATKAGLDPKQLETIRAVTSKREMAELLSNPDALGNPVIHSFAARRGPRLLAGLWSGYLPGEDAANPTEGLSLVLCELNRDR